MSINTSVYGESSSWQDSRYLATGAMKAKVANFGTAAAPLSTLGDGATVGKTPHNELIDRSISFSALGTESLYSHINYIYNNEVYTDNEYVTEFFWSECDPQDNIRNIDNIYYPAINASEAFNCWKNYTTDPNNYYYNYSALTKPIVELNPKKILYILEVLPCQGDGTQYSGGNQQGWVFIGDYNNNTGRVQTNYPYIKAARLSPRIDNSNTSTPSRSQLTDAESYFGISINRELKNCPVEAIRLYYTIFKNGISNNTIPIYGSNRGYVLKDSGFISLLLCPPEDIDSDSNYFWAQHQYDSNFYEYLIKQAACFGVYFRVLSTGGAATSMALDNPSVYLGVLDSNGIGHGDYTSGADNRNNDIWNWSSYSESPYDYTKPIDPTDYNNHTSFYALSPVWSCNNMYVTTEEYIIAAAQALATAISLRPADMNINDYSLGAFLTNNPIDCIISIKKFPIQDIARGSLTNIKFGAYDNAAVKGCPIQTMHDRIEFVFSSGNNLYPVFGNSFLDYEPYTHAELIIPFCGSVQLPMADFMGETIKVKLIVDYITGACTAYVCRGDLAITSISGQIGIDVPISGVQGATLQSQIVNANLQYKAQQLAGAGIAAGAVVSGVSAVGSVATGNAIGAVGSAAGLVTTATKAMQHEVTEYAAEYAAHHVQVPFKQVSAGSPLVSGVYEYACRLIIYRPVLDSKYDSAEYGHTVGFATIESGTLGEHTGLVQVSNVDLSGVPCTIQEARLIESALKEGVYV